MIEQRLADMLTGNATIAAICADRIYPVIVRENTAFPCIIYRRLSGSGEYTLTGPMGWRTITDEITCFATTYSGARALADAVRKALDGYVEGSSAGAIRFMSVADGADEFAPELEVYGCSVLATIEYDDTQENL